MNIPHWLDQKKVDPTTDMVGSMQLSHGVCDSLELWGRLLHLAGSSFGRTEALPCYSDNPGPKTAERILTGLSPPAPREVSCWLSAGDHQSDSPNYLLGRRLHWRSSFSTLNQAVSCPHANSPILLGEPSPRSMELPRTWMWFCARSVFERAQWLRHTGLSG